MSGLIVSGLIEPEQWWLRDVIARLEQVADPSMVMPFGLSEPHSYRGAYECVAFVLAPHVTVAQSLTVARSAIGMTYDGWKGGEYTMYGTTDPYVVAERGRTGEYLGRLMVELLLVAAL